MADGTDIYVNQEIYVDGDAKPSGAFIGQKLKATNGKVWEWSGATWALIVDVSSDGSSVLVAAIKDTVTVRQEIEMGALQDYDLIEMLAADTEVITWDVSMYDEMQVTVAVAGTPTDSISIHTTHDGVNYSPVVTSGRDASTNGTYIPLTALVSGQYTIPLNARKVKFTKNGTTDAAVITWSAKSTGRRA